MPIIQAMIFLFCIGIVSVMFLYFFQQHKKLKELHAQRLFVLKRDLDLHLGQIAKRTRGLDTYHFLHYNLDEALILQKEIYI